MNMSQFFIFLIKLYQKRFSKYFKGACIYSPPCSSYGIKAIEKYGAKKGVALTIKRFLRCRFPYEGGHDPVENYGGPAAGANAEKVCHWASSLGTEGGSLIQPTICDFGKKQRR